MASSLAFRPVFAAAASGPRPAPRAARPASLTSRSVQLASSSSSQQRASLGRDVRVRARATDSAAPSNVDESDAVDGVTPAFGPGSPQWPEVHAELRAMGVRTISVADAREMLSSVSGAAIADVRPRIEFEEFRPGVDGDPDAPDVRNVPYMVPHRSAAKRWQGYFLCTKDGLKERDWRFTRSFAEAFPDKSAPIIVGCKTGGDISAAPVTIDPVTKRQVFPEGSSQYTDKSRSNSLMAVYELAQAGYTNLYHLEGGVTKWCLDGETHQGDPNAFYFHPTILPGILFQLIMVEGIVVRSNLAYVKKFHPENFETINANNAAYSMINDFVANSPINWMFDYYN